jgi:hypothetical protein
MTNNFFSKLSAKDELRKKLIKDYEIGLDYAKKLKNAGRENIIDNLGGTTYNVVSIDDYINYWEVGLKALLSGADPEKYDF